MTGRVIKSTGSWYTVETPEGRRFECRIKGKFRIKGIRATNPFAVGDRVDFETEEGQETAVITHLHERFNYIIRKSVNQSHEMQILAANIDQAFLLVTLVQPRTSLGFIDRFLVSAEAFHIPVHLLFNKFDLYTPESLDTVRDFERIYNGIGYKVLELSVYLLTGLEPVKALVHNRTTLISGHSGAGKSTLINYLLPGLQLKTSEISDSSEKGVHTTTFAEMYGLSDGGYVIDSPGIRELGVTGIAKQELSHYFPEMKALLHACRFHNCQHMNEPGCAVIAAVEDGFIEPSRYDSYTSIYLNQDTRS